MSANLTLNTASNDEVYEYVNPDTNEIIEYDINRLVFCDTVPESIPSAPSANGKPTPPMVNYRINIQDKRADGKLQDFLIRTESCFGIKGIQQCFDQTTGGLTGYSLPLGMWNQDGATPSQKYFTDLLDKIVLPKIKEHLVSVKKTFKKPLLETGDLRDMKFFYRKADEDGVIDPDNSPLWYPKIIASKKQNLKIITRFYQMDERGNSCVDERGNPVELDPSRLIDKRGVIKAVVKIESIYIGTKITVQCKVWEADYRPTESALPRKGKINLSKATVVRTDETNPMAVLLMGAKSSSLTPDDTSDEKETSGDFEAGGDITLTDDVEEGTPTVVPLPVAEKKVIRRVVVKKV